MPPRIACLSAFPQEPFIQVPEGAGRGHMIAGATGWSPAWPCPGRKLLRATGRSPLHLMGFPPRMRLTDLTCLISGSRECGP